MDWNSSWIINGGFALIFGICNLIFTMRSNRISSVILMFRSLAFGMFSVLGEYQTVNSWIPYGELSFATNIVPNIVKILELDIAALVFLNLFSLIIGLRKNSRRF